MTKFMTIMTKNVAKENETGYAGYGLESSKRQKYKKMLYTKMEAFVMLKMTKKAVL